jgi:chemotaxis protein CheD
MEQANTHYLYPAALFASREPYLVNTILGSCVAVCLIDQITRTGGINHFMLPFWNGQGLASPKFGNIAIERLIEKMISLGAKKSNLKAKIFGGGEVIETKIKQFNIGERNIQVAYNILEDYRIPILGASTGGKYGRKIQFNTATGEIRQKLIKKENIPHNIVK